MWASRHYENIIAGDAADAISVVNRHYVPQGWYAVSAVEYNRLVADPIIAKYAALGKRLFAVHCHRTGIKHVNCKGVRPSLPAGYLVKGVPPIPGEKGYDPQKLTINEAHKAAARRAARA